MPQDEEAVAPKPSRKLAWRLGFVLMLLASAAIGALAGLLFVYSTDLPQVSELESYRPSAITELYDDQGRVIGSFALQRRVVLAYEDFPTVLREAILSIEDKGFERHWGISFWRVAGAAWRDIMSGSRAQGASTLTMQLSRNLFLTPDRTFSRKIQEAMLAIQIERRFTKHQIFAMYANQIFLGHGVYGFEAGSQYYFGKRARDLSLEEAALLAGLPKAPNSYSPYNNLERSQRRRNLVINAMLEDGKITTVEATRAKAAPVVLKRGGDPVSIAPYFVEEVRRYLERRYGSEQVHEGRLKVYTSLNMEMQQAANAAVLDGLAAYERRRGWRGELPNVLAQGGTIEGYAHPEWNSVSAGAYVHALVTAVAKDSATLKVGHATTELTPSDAKWTGAKALDAILKPGDLAYVKIVSLDAAGRARVTLEQDSGTQAALVALDNATGDIKAMVGGRSFATSKFNRATQALRQVGSSFKPYVYAAAIESGLTPDDVVLDAPTVFRTASGSYAPRNYDGKFEGNITLRRALAQSRNIPALKVADKIGLSRVIETAKRFGIRSELPPYLPIALGAADMLVIEHTAAFAAFPNDGVRVAPRYIRKVTDTDGHVLEENFPEVSDAVSARTARTLVDMMRGVVEHGTATRARELKHPLAGKTGTTNDFTDAWFVGYSPSITCGVWMGFDDRTRTLGNKETGGVAALPVWIDFMRVALRGRETETFAPPPPPEQGPVQAAQKVDRPDTAPAENEGH